MKKTVCIIALLIASMMISDALFSQTRERKGRELFYTYFGPVAGFGYSMAQYETWKNNSWQTVKANGINANGGALLNIFIGNFVGDFSVEWMYNAPESMQHMHYRAMGKYLWTLNDTFAAGCGFGIYLETPPSTKTYNGSAGVMLPLSLAITTGFDSKLVVDIYGKYGSYGVGENSSKISTGMSIGFLFKVGRI